jgi:2'-5' RNA ligase
MTAAAEPALLFLALDPDAELTALVQAYKDRTAELVGAQLYLEDRPHLTVYLAPFPPRARVWEAVQPVLAEAPPRVSVVGWHVFEADALTGHNTLVCDLDEASRQELRRLQRRVVEAVAPLRDHEASERRFAGRLEHLTPEQWEHVRRHGFPFVGDGWHPHFTVASVRREDWPGLFAELRDRPPVGRFSCPRLKLYRLVDNRPQLVEAREFAGR